jgi:hypothetical protein
LERPFFWPAVEPPPGEVEIRSTFNSCTI